MVRLGLAFALVLAALVGQAVPDGTPPKEVTPDEEYELQRALVDALDQVERNYVKPISRRELVEAAIEGVLRKLDPYSTYISPDELDLFRASVESEFGGIGIQITLDDGRLTVLSPLVDTPAYEAGILAGDVILKIDGESTDDLDMDEAIRKLKGEIGSKVTLTVLHPGQSEPKDIAIKRRRIHVETVLGDRRKADNSWEFMLDPDKRIGYVRVTAFSRQTASELRKALESLTKQKMAGLVLDLRFNPGGLLSSGIEVSDLFLASGRIVSTAGRNTVERSWDAHKKDTFEGFPIVVLVNRYTASAAEIVSACLQDHKRAVVMGERTWGKGSVQNVVALENGHSALKLTTAAYRRPSGKNIHRFPDATDEDEWGVTPDEGHELDLSDLELVALLRERRERDIIAAKPAAPKPGEKASVVQRDAASKRGAAPRANPDPKKPIVADRLLKMAVEYLDHELARAK
ncbi:MAG: S41 family peptidase [Pirellulales bacterium]|nr:S41 family peptidase [Pirellulales bacterium]